MLVCIFIFSSACLNMHLLLNFSSRCRHVPDSYLALAYVPLKISEPYFSERSAVTTTPAYGARELSPFTFGWFLLRKQLFEPGNWFSGAPSANMCLIQRINLFKFHPHSHTHTHIATLHMGQHPWVDADCSIENQRKPLQRSMTRQSARRGNFFQLVWQPLHMWLDAWVGSGSSVHFSPLCYLCPDDYSNHQRWDAAAVWYCITDTIGSRQPGRQPGGS